MVKEYVTQVKNRVKPTSKLDTNFKSVNVLSTIEELDIFLDRYPEGLIIIDENLNAFISSIEFASKVKHSNNYFLIVTRRNLQNIPHSVKSIYVMESKTKGEWGKGFTNSTISNKFEDTDVECKKLDALITEDSGSGFDFFSSSLNCSVETSEGSSNVLKKLVECIEKYDSIGIVVDSAAFGPYIERLVDYFKSRGISNKDLYVFLPESFEYLILQSNLFKNKSNIKALLKDPSLYCETAKYFSYERLFTKVVSEEFSKIKINYNKGKHNLEVQNNLSYHKDSILSGLKGFPKENIKE